MSQIETAVFKIFTQESEKDVKKPWVSNISDSSGTGFCIQVPQLARHLKIKNEKFILTNAHVIENATKVMVRRYGESIMWIAQIEYALYECDLAILTVSEAAFWTNIDPLYIGGIPKSGDKIKIYGYPLHQINLNITKGYVNRMYLDIMGGTISSKSIAIQTDAPVNSGNSGGPVLNKQNKVVGVAFASAPPDEHENIGLIIPSVTIRFFISSILNDMFPDNNARRFRGLCRSNLQYQSTHNHSIREYIKIPPNISGVLTTYSGNNDIKIHDVITKIEDVPIDNSGNMQLNDIIKLIDSKHKFDSETQKYLGKLEDTAFGGKEILPISNLFGMMNTNTKLTVAVFRGGKEHNVQLILKPPVFIMPMASYQIDPGYLFVLGMIFMSLNYMLVRRIHNDGQNVNYTTIPEKSVTQLVILSDIYTSELTEDFPNNNNVIHKVNNTIVKNLQHLHDIFYINKPKSKTFIVTFYDTNKIVIINNSDIKQYNKKMLEDLNIHKLYIADK